MMCLTPSVSDLNLTLPLEVPIANVSFLLDGVMEYAPLQNNGQISGLDEAFIFVPDPVFYQFENQKVELEFDQRKFIKISVSNKFCLLKKKKTYKFSCPYSNFFGPITEA